MNQMPCGNCPCFLCSKFKSYYSQFSHSRNNPSPGLTPGTLFIFSKSKMKKEAWGDEEEKLEDIQQNNSHQCINTYFFCNKYPYKTLWMKLAKWKMYWILSHGLYLMNHNLSFLYQLLVLEILQESCALPLNYQLKPL